MIAPKPCPPNQLAAREPNRGYTRGMDFAQIRGTRIAMHGPIVLMVAGACLAGCATPEVLRVPALAPGMADPGDRTEAPLPDYVEHDAQSLPPPTLAPQASDTGDNAAPPPSP